MRGDDACYDGSLDGGRDRVRPRRYRTSFAIDDADTGLWLTAKCVRHRMPLALRLVADAARDPSSIPAVEQDLRLRHFAFGVTAGP